MMHLAFDQAVKNKLLAQNLVEGVRLPKAEKHEMRVLDREEQTRLTLAARRAPEPAAFGIIFVLFTGLRMGELCGLRWENVDMDNRFFKVCETRNRLPNFDDSIETSTSVKTVRATKTDNSRRTVSWRFCIFVYHLGLRKTTSFVLSKLVVFCVVTTKSLFLKSVAAQQLLEIQCSVLFQNCSNCPSGHIHFASRYKYTLLDVFYLLNEIGDLPGFLGTAIEH